MTEHYTYADIYGTLLHKNEDDTERTYFVLECQYHKFYVWMYQYGWNKVKEKACERNGLRGYKVTLKTNHNKGGHMEIILYTTGCPKCKVLEAKLKQKGLEYKEITDINEIANKGFMTVPILEVDNKTMNFTEANTWINERN